MGAQHSTVRGDHTEYGFWLVFDRDGGMRFSRGAPTCSRYERAMHGTAVIPHSLFDTPSLSVRIDITDQAPEAAPIDLAAAGTALRGALGVDVDIRIVEPES